MQVVQMLLEHGMGCCSNNALEAAARNGNVKCMELLVQYGALLQPCWYSDAPVNKLLEGAISHHKADAVAWLLQQGIPANACALRHAIQCDQVECLRVLLQHGVNDEGNLALFAAALKRDGALLRLLVEALPPSEQPAALEALFKEEKRYTHGYISSVKKVIKELAQKAGRAQLTVAPPAPPTATLAGGALQSAITAKTEKAAGGAGGGAGTQSQVAAVTVQAAAASSLTTAPTQAGNQQQQQQPHHQQHQQQFAWLQRSDPRQNSRWPQQVQRSDSELEGLRAARKCFCCTRAGHPWYRCYQYFPR
jgi:ankyrin repeat protein